MQSQLLKIWQAKHPMPLLVVLPDRDNGDFRTARGDIADAISVALPVWDDRPIASVAVKKVSKMMSHIA
jgi:hypothetical protein